MIKSIRLIGWSTIILSIIVILTETFGLFSNPMEQLNSLLNSIPQFRNSVESINEMIQYNRIWSIYSILYFTFALIGSAQFIRYKNIGRSMLEMACWIGILNAFINFTFSYMLWNNLQTAMSNTMTVIGVGTSILSPIGFIAIGLSFLLWIIPSIGMIFYLKRPQLKALMHS